MPHDTDAGTTQPSFADASANPVTERSKGKARARRPFSDRYVFAKTMQDNPDLCREIIEAALDMEIGDMEAIEVESATATVIRKSVRFDVYLRSEGRAFELEMQAYEQHALPMRMRYYHAMFDRRLLNRGDAFDALPDVYVVFICTGDPFGLGLPRYTFQSTCRESPNARFANGVTDVVLSAKSDGLDQVGPVLSELLRYVRTGKVCGPFSGRLQDAVDRAYDDEEWVESMDMYDWDLEYEKELVRKEAQAEGMATGLAEGRAKGLAEGRAKGKEEGEGLFAQLISSLISKGRQDDVARAATDPDYRRMLYAEYGIA